MFHVEQLMKYYHKHFPKLDFLLYDFLTQAFQRHFKIKHHVSRGNIIISIFQSLMFAVRFFDANLSTHHFKIKHHVSRGTIDGILS